MSASVHDPVANLLDTYHSLNAAVLDELDSEPSALEFMRYVATNRPFVVRGMATHWPAVEKWGIEYLKDQMEGEHVRVAVTPFGNADAVVEADGEVPMFVEPYEITEPFSDFLDALLLEEENSPPSPASTSGTNEAQPTLNVRYAQPQNDSLRNEYPSLAPDVPPDIPFARIALQQSADAVNIWLGGDRSVTALHKDNYENLYAQIRGEKHFVLLPPVAMPCVNEREVLKARYAPAASTDGTATSSIPLKIVPDELGEHVPVPMWDPDWPEHRATSYSPLAQPLRVTLREGDVLYLPAMWYHKVSQSRGEAEFVCAVNYWYDMEFAGAFWTGMNFVREMVEQRRKTAVDYGELTMDIS